MRSPILAMLWREWRRSWLSMLLLVLFCCPLSVFSDAIATAAAADDLSGAATFVGLFVFAFVSTLGRSGGRESQTMPRYFLTLPMGTVTWASLHFLYGVTTLALLAFGLTSWHVYLFGPESGLPFGFPPSPWLVAAFFVCIGSLFEGLFLFVAGTGSGVLAVLVAGLYVPATFAGTIYLAFADRLQFRSFAVSVWMAGTAVGYLLCLAGVALYRRGTWQGLRAYLLWEAIPGLARHRRPFKSPDEAQVWFEWKRFGRYFPIAACCMIAAAIALYALMDPRELHRLLRIRSNEPFPQVAMFLFLAAIGLGIYMTIRRYWDHTSGFNCFVLTLPVSTRAMASARLKMAIGSILICYVAVEVIVLTYAWVNDEAQHATLMDLLRVGQGILASVAVCWTLLWLAIPLFYAYIGCMIIMAIVYAAFSPFDYVSPELAVQLLWLPLVVLVLAGFLALRAAKRRELLTRGSLYGMLIMPCLALFSVRGEFSGNLDLSTIVLALCLGAALILLPALPFVTVPLTIAWYRHR